MRTYLPTDSFIYKNIQTNSDKKVVFLSGLGLEINKQREGFLRRYVLNQGVSYLALDYTRATFENKHEPDYRIGETFSKTMDILGQDNKKLFLCGLCYGGLIALKVAAKIPERVAGVFALSPAYETEDFPWIENTNTFLKKKEERLANKKVDQRIIQQMILFRQIVITAFKTLGREKIPTSFQGPLHIFHGGKDRLIPVENSIHIKKVLNNPNCVLHITPDAGHTLNDDFEMRGPIRALHEYLVRS